MTKVRVNTGETGIKVLSPGNRLSITSAKKTRTVPGKVQRADAIIFSNSGKKPESQMTHLEKMERLRKGISKKDLVTLKARTKLDYDKLANLLSVTRATLINKAGSEKFNNVLSERILSLAVIYSYGYEVFEDEEKFNRWMFKENKALGGKMPYELCNNQFGREEVKNLIGRIDYGVYS